MSRSHRGKGDATRVLWQQPAESFEDEEPGVFDEIVETSDEEEVVDDDGFALAQLGLRGVKVERDVQTLDKL